MVEIIDNLYYKNMNNKFIIVILVSLVVLRIINGDFISPANALIYLKPSLLDYIELVLLVVALFLSLIPKRK